MARIVTELYPLRDTDEAPGDLSHVVSDTSLDSMAEEKEQSMFGKITEIDILEKTEYKSIILISRQIAKRYFLMSVHSVCLSIRTA